MSDLRLVLYKDNRAPRSIALSTRIIYRTMLLAVLAAAVLLVSIGAAVRFYLVAKAKSSPATLATSISSEGEEIGPSNSPEEQNKALLDEIEKLRARLQNAAAVQAAPKEIDKRNPALALFAPVVSDRSQDQNLVNVANFKVTPEKDRRTSLTFELHNAHPGESTEKGYIVVLGRGEQGLYVYPNAFNKTGPYLLDFERGETFQVARFRLVNAQFEGEAKAFQILIFTRKGELLVNTLHEVKSGT